MASLSLCVLLRESYCVTFCASRAYSSLCCRTTRSCATRSLSSPMSFSVFCIEEWRSSRSFLQASTSRTAVSATI